jgi:hypothetical protein
MFFHWDVLHIPYTNVHIRVPGYVMNTRFASLLAALFPLIIYAVMEQERRTNPEPKMAIATTGSHLLFLQEGFIDASYQHAAGQCGRAVRTRPSRRPEPELTRPCSPPRARKLCPTISWVRGWVMERWNFALRLLQEFSPSIALWLNSGRPGARVSRCMIELNTSSSALHVSQPQEERPCLATVPLVAVAFWKKENNFCWIDIAC